MVISIETNGICLWPFEKELFQNDRSCYARKLWELASSSFCSPKIDFENLLRQSRKEAPETNIIKGANQVVSSSI